jgi:hypothetical protein
LALIAGIAAPQVDFGTMTGTVTDPSGAALPLVQINILQTEANFRFQTVTNGEGNYRVQSLQPGTYLITFAIAGFKRLVRDNVTLQTGAVLPVNAALEVGSALVQTGEWQAMMTRCNGSYDRRSVQRTALRRADHHLVCRLVRELQAEPTIWTSCWRTAASP